MSGPSPHLVPIRPSNLVSIEAGNVAADTPSAGETPITGMLTLPRWIGIVGGLTVAALAVCLFCLKFGAVPIELGTIMSSFWQTFISGSLETDGMDASAVIMLHLRLPRVLLGFFVGSTLASVGVVLQALLRNPLADPYVLGVSSGAALGVSLAMLLGVGTTVGLLSPLPLFGFVGGLISLGLMYRLAQSQGRLPIQSLLLAGVILNAILTALIMFVTSIMAPNRSAGLMAWLMGSLTAPNYAALSVLALYGTMGVAILVKMAHALNVLTLGEETARSLGIHTERFKKQLFGLTALLTGAVVAVSGMIGFVGMVVPHAMRMLVGSDHRLLLPVSALTGGIFLVVSDTIARSLLAPTEIPVGIVTALAGGPFFLHLLFRQKHWMT